MLVVDDEAENVEFLRRMFRKTYDVEVASSGTEALSRLEQDKFDVIITDQMMPGMTGTELLTRSLILAPDAIRILVTGFPDLESAIASINEGRAYRFFTKPIDRKELAGAVDTALDQIRSGEVLRRQVEELLHQRDHVSRRFDALREEIDREVAKRSEGLFEEVARLRERNPYDEESQLYNRIAITQRLEEELARSERYGLLCSFALLRIVDLSHIDAPGGAIERLSALLRLSLRRFDAAGRWTKDTFAVLMPHTDQRGAESVVARLHAMVSDDEQGPTIPLAGSIAVYPSTGSSASELVAEAEKALADAS